MEAVIAKLEEQGTDEEVITSYKEQMTSAQQSQLENLSRTVNKCVTSAVLSLHGCLYNPVSWQKHIVLVATLWTFIVNGTHSHTHPFNGPFPGLPR